MSLLSKIKNVANVGSAAAVHFAAPQIAPAFSVTMPQAHSFKGFRRAKLKYIDVDGCAETLDAFRSSGFDFKNSLIRIDGFNKVSNGESSRFANVYVDGRKCISICAHMQSAAAEHRRGYRLILSTQKGRSALLRPSC